MRNILLETHFAVFNRSSSSHPCNMGRIHKSSNTRFVDNLFVLHFITIDLYLILFSIDWMRKTRLKSKSISAWVEKSIALQQTNFSLKKKVKIFAYNVFYK